MAARYQYLPKSVILHTRGHVYHFQNTVSHVRKLSLDENNDTHEYNDSIQFFNSCMETSYKSSVIVCTHVVFPHVDNKCDTRSSSRSSSNGSSNNNSYNITPHSTVFKKSPSTYTTPLCFLLACLLAQSLGHMPLSKQNTVQGDE